mmetsp:Transcript_8946/g.17460  ORF Transcript_8946/g.17460 Transcript_8946/m.17460 type:complete len:267 (+) Transcript_8946:526-1326(+)
MPSLINASWASKIDPSSSSNSIICSFTNFAVSSIKLDNAETSPSLDPKAAPPSFDHTGTIRCFTSSGISTAGSSSSASMFFLPIPFINPRRIKAWFSQGQPSQKGRDGLFKGFSETSRHATPSNQDTIVDTPAASTLSASMHFFTTSCTDISPWSGSRRHEGWSLSSSTGLSTGSLRAFRNLVPRSVKGSVREKLKKAVTAPVESSRTERSAEGRKLTATESTGIGTLVCAFETTTPTLSAISSRISCSLFPFRSVSRALSLDFLS